jgi:hypothetical protein
MRPNAQNLSSPKAMRIGQLFFLMRMELELQRQQTLQ